MYKTAISMIEIPGSNCRSMHTLHRTDMISSIFVRTNFSARSARDARTGCDRQEQSPANASRNPTIPEGTPLFNRYVVAKAAAQKMMPNV